MCVRPRAPTYYVLLLTKVGADGFGKPMLGVVRGVARAGTVGGIHDAV